MSRLHRFAVSLEWPMAILALLVIPALVMEERALSPVVVRYVIGQLREALREALRAGGPRVLVLRGGGRFRRAPQGQIVPAKDAPTDVLTFPLSDLLDARLERAAAAERRATPDVWTGHRRVSAEAVSSSLATPMVSV